MHGCEDRDVPQGQCGISHLDNVDRLSFIVYTTACYETLRMLGLLEFLCIHCTVCVVES